MGSCPKHLTNSPFQNGVNSKQQNTQWDCLSTKGKKVNKFDRLHEGHHLRTRARAYLHIWGDKYKKVQLKKKKKKRF